MHLLHSRHNKMKTRFQAGNRRARSGLLVLLCSLLGGAQLEAENTSPLVLPVKPGISVSGPQVTLADLAIDPAALPDGWAQRTILSAPEPGKTETVPLINIAYALREYPDMANVTLRGATRMTLQRSGVAVDPALILAAIEDYATQSSDCRETKIQAALVEPSAVIITGSTNFSIEVVGLEYNRRAGVHLFEIALLDDAGAEQRLKIPARVSVLSQVWVATRPIKAGTVIGLEDIRIQEASADFSARRNIPATEPIVGYEAERQILAGEPIQKTAIRQPLCAEKGSLIEVTAQRGALSISLRAQALTRGRRGDKIVCINTGSKRQMLTRLTGPGKAELIGL